MEEPCYSLHQHFSIVRLICRGRVAGAPSSVLQKKIKYRISHWRRTKAEIKTKIKNGIYIHGIIYLSALWWPGSDIHNLNEFINLNRQHIFIYMKTRTKSIPCFICMQILHGVGKDNLSLKFL